METVATTCRNCGRENSYVPGQGCPGCHWLDDEAQDAAPVVGQHTPGPWILFDGKSSSNNGGQLVLKAGTAYTVAIVPVDTVKFGEFTADAHLLAAAPDLLAALKGLLSLEKPAHDGAYDRYGPGFVAPESDWGSRWRGAHETVAKAEGR